MLHLATSFHRGEAISETDCPEDKHLLQLLPDLNESQLTVLIWLSGGLASEAGKLLGSNPIGAKIHSRMEIIAQDASSVLLHTLASFKSSSSADTKRECLSCYLSWVEFAQPTWTRKLEALDVIRQPTMELVYLLSDEEAQDDAMDVFRDILDCYPNFLRPEHMKVLAAFINDQIQQPLLSGLKSGDLDLLPMTQFVIAYGTANVQEIVERPEHGYGSRATMQILLACLQTPGYPGNEDEVSIQSIEFWNTYIEYVNDIVFSAQPSDSEIQWLKHSKSVCMSLSYLLWSKMRPPPPDVAQTWTEHESEAFRDFRKDGSDLMISVFLLVGLELLQRFVEIAQNSVETKQWQDLETALFCIDTLGDNASEEQDAEPILGQLFGSDLFRTVADFSQPIPLQVRRTAIDMLGTYGQYIERHAEFLPDTLRFLFASLENSSLSLTAAKSIAALCSTCRRSLTGELSGFLEQYRRFAASETSEPYTNEKVMGAIAAIIQAVSPEDAKAGPLSALLDQVDALIASMEELLARVDFDKSHELAVSALECLAAIGKGMQVPEDVPINLYDDGAVIKAQQSFWHTQGGQQVQVRIVNTCYTVLQRFAKSGEVIEAICQVFRSGFTESEPGPFVFAPATAIGFFEQCTLETPRLEGVLSMVCTLIVQASRSDSARIDADIARICSHVRRFVEALSDPRNDPHIAQGCIDVLTRMVVRYSNVLLDAASASHDSVKVSLDFCIKAIAGADLMPKRVGAEFWSKFIRIPQSSAEESARLRSTEVVMSYGPILCLALIVQITGRAQRSELDQLCEPLKALITTQVHAQTWIEEALHSPNLPKISPNVGDVEKRRFIMSLVATRGDNRKVRDLVKTFYAACRGTVSSYA